MSLGYKMGDCDAIFTGLEQRLFLREPPPQCATWRRDESFHATFMDWTARYWNISSSSVRGRWKAFLGTTKVNMECPPRDMPGELGQNGRVEGGVSRVKLRPGLSPSPLR